MPDGRNKGLYSVRLPRAEAEQTALCQGQNQAEEITACELNFRPAEMPAAAPANQDIHIPPWLFPEQKSCPAEDGRQIRNS